MSDPQASIERSKIYFGLTLQNIISVVLFIGTVVTATAAIMSKINMAQAQLESQGKWILNMQATQNNHGERISKIEGKLGVQ